MYVLCNKYFELKKNENICERVFQGRIVFALSSKRLYLRQTAPSVLCGFVCLRGVLRSQGGVPPDAQLETSNDRV